MPPPFPNYCMVNLALGTVCTNYDPVVQTIANRVGNGVPNNSHMSVQCVCVCVFVCVRLLWKG